MHHHLKIRCHGRNFSTTKNKKTNKKHKWNHVSQFLFLDHPRNSPTRYSTYALLKINNITKYGYILLLALLYGEMENCL